MGRCLVIILEHEKASTGIYMTGIYR